MALAFIEPLSQIHSAIQNVPLTETGARELEGLVSQAIQLLQGVPLKGSDLLSIRVKATQRGLESDVLHYLKQYWLTPDKVSRMSKLTQARSQACLLLQQVLAMSKK